MLILVGGLLVYSGIKNRHPIDLLKLALTGKDISSAKPLSDSASQPEGLGKALGDIAGQIAPGLVPQATTPNTGTVTV